MDEFKPVFSINNLNDYKIQINILYNIKEGDDTNISTDELDSNYYIIDNMRDILLEEFSYSETYNNFKIKYKDKTPLPLYIVNDSFYIDKYVIDNIRKTTVGKFPGKPNSESDAEANFKTNLRRFRAENTLYEAELLKFFKVILIDVLTTLKKSKSDITLSITDKSINEIPTLDKLSKDCMMLIRKPAFYTFIRNYYDTLKASTLKDALRAFYNISKNSLSDKYKYEYFLDTKTINDIFKFISESNNEDDDPFNRGYGRRYSLNNNQTKEEIYNKYFKYVFPNKKDITYLSDQDKDKILMFNNVYYIIKNIYLLDNTIINVKNYKSGNNKPHKYYISQVSLLDLKDNITHFKIEKNKVTIFVKANLKFIMEDPILQINYLIDDLENAKQNFLPQTYILQPKDINSNYSSYDKIYIHDNVKYTSNSQAIETVAINSRKRGYIKNKEELFLNTKAIQLFDKYFEKQIEKQKTDKTEVDYNIITLNIKYLLYTIFKFYNNKEFKKYYIANTYIKYFNEITGIPYYSITKGDIKEGNLSKKYEIISNLFKDLSSTGDEEEDEEEEAKAKEAKAKAKAKEAKAKAKEAKAKAEEDEEGEEEKEEKEGEEGEEGEEEGKVKKKNKAPIIFQIIKSPDARLENNNIYKINVVFRCYLNKNGKKPDFVRKIIAEKCLTRAQKLDEAFTNTLYRAFDLPENYLYNKLTNITRKQKPNVAPNVDLENKINPVAQEENIAINMPYKRGGRGGRGGKVTKKYNHNKNSAKIKFINNVY
jgi:hypothetical protein